MMCLLIKFTCVIGQLYFFSNDWREMFQAITSPTEPPGFFHFPRKLVFSSPLYGHSSKILLFAHGVTVHASPCQQWLVCIQSIHHHFIKSAQVQIVTTLQEKKNHRKAHSLGRKTTFQFVFQLSIQGCSPVTETSQLTRTEIKHFITDENEGTMVQFFWLSGSHVAQWKFSQKQKVREPQIKSKPLSKSSVKYLPLILIQIINGFTLNAQVPFFCLLYGKNPVVWFAGKN